MLKLMRVDQMRQAQLIDEIRVILLQLVKSSSSPTPDPPAPSTQPTTSAEQIIQEVLGAMAQSGMTSTSPAANASTQETTPVVLATESSELQ